MKAMDLPGDPVVSLPEIDQDGNKDFVYGGRASGTRTTIGASALACSRCSRVSALSLEDYAIYMIVHSDNTATNVSIDELGMEAINRLSASLGATGPSCSGR